MKTIIQVVQHLRPGGIEIIALDLLTCCTDDEQTFIVSLEGNLDAAIDHWPKLAQYRDNLIFMDKKPGLTLSMLMPLVRLFTRLKATAVHSHHIGPLLYGGIAARMAGIKQLTHTEHDAWHLDSTKRCYLQRALITLLRPMLVADAQAVADNMRKKLKYRGTISVVRNGINSARFIPGDQHSAREQLKLPLGVSLIGCSGRMERVKGQSVLISAMAELSDHIHLALAGSGSIEAELRKQVTQFGLTQRVHFLGHIDQMPTFYQSLDLFCLPSLNEGLPLSPLEAQACNIKTLVTDVGASKETLCPESGQFVVANDPTAMAQTLEKMLNSPSNAQPRAFVKQHGDVHIMAQAYADLRNHGV